MDILNKQSLQLLKMICGGAAVISGAFAAWFEFRDRGQTVEEREKTRLSYRQKWQTIQDTKILDLPRKTIIRTLELKSKVVKWYDRLLTDIPDWFYIGFYTIIIPVSGFFVAWFNLNLTFGIFIGIFLGCIIAMILISGGHRRVEYTRFEDILLYVFVIAVILIGIGWVNFLLSKGIVLATVGFLASFPLLGFLLSIGSAGITRDIKLEPLLVSTTDLTLQDEDMVFLGFTIALSFTVTMGALIIGYYVSPNSHIPQTVQMMFSNVICDGLTMLCTIIILSKVVSPKVSLPIPIAVLLDVFMAGLLACVSLYLGLLGSEHSITIRQTINVLIALSPNGANWEIGPYFWAMHTSFLPTLAYLSLISLYWVARLLVLPIANLFFRGSAVEKPHHLTAGLFLFVGAVFTALAVIIGFVPE